MKALPKAGAVFPMNFIISEKPVKPWLPAGEANRRFYVNSVWEHVKTLDFQGKISPFPEESAVPCQGCRVAGNVDDVSGCDGCDVTDCLPAAPCPGGIDNDRIEVFRKG